MRVSENEAACRSKKRINKGCCLTLLTEVTGQAVVEIFVEVCAMSLLQSCAQTEVRELHVTLETEKRSVKNAETADALKTISAHHLVTTTAAH